MIGKRPQLLTWNPADELGVAFRHKIRQADERIRRETNVGIEKYEERISRVPGENVAGVLFAAPVGRQRRCCFKPHARIAAHKTADNLCSGVGGAIIQDDHFKFDTGVGQDRLKCRVNIPLLIACGD